MEQKVENKIELKDKLISFYYKNKLKIYLFFSVLIIVLISTTLIKINIEKKNSQIAEKYIKANLLLTSGKKENSKKIYEEIILSKNKFYSVLSLNTLIEKKLETNKDIILDYFKIVENLNHSEANLDLIILKKALFLNKNSEIKNSNDLLKRLINKDSKLKKIAEDLIVK